MPVFPFIIKKSIEFEGTDFNIQLWVYSYPNFQSFQTYVLVRLFASRGITAGDFQQNWMGFLTENISFQSSYTCFLIFQNRGVWLWGQELSQSHNGVINVLMITMNKCRLQECVAYKILCDENSGSTEL